MEGERITLSIPMQIAFGVCPDFSPTPDEEGAILFEYRYVPSGLWMLDITKTIAQLNRASSVYPTFAEYPSDLIAEEPPEGARELTETGRAFFKSCPLYATLHAKEPMLTWTSYRPDGNVAIEARGGHFENMMANVVSVPPIDVWAAVCFEPWGKYFEAHPTLGFWPMYMAGPDGQKGGEWETYPVTERPPTMPFAHPRERVEFPGGLYKKVLAAVAPNKLHVCKRYPNTETMRLVQGSVASRATAESDFVWSDHWFFEFIVPAQYVGRMLHWMDKNDFTHPAPWAIRTVNPVFDPEIVEVKFSVDPEQLGYDTLFIVQKPLDELGMSTRLQYEMDVSHIERPPL